jgi:Flp pilus assembly pilin Flp
MNKRKMIELFRDTRGANMVEYIILVGIVALLGIFGFRQFAGSVSTEITTQGTTVQSINNTQGTQAP